MNENPVWYLIEVYPVEGTSKTFGPICVEEQRSSRSSLEFKLMPNYPNPFNPSTTIPFCVPDDLSGSAFQIRLLNLQGEEVRLLKNEKYNAGEHSLVWDGRNEFGETVSSGIYIAQLQTQNYPVQTIRLTKVK